MHNNLEDICEIKGKYISKRERKKERKREGGKKERKTDRQIAKR